MSNSIVTGRKLDLISCKAKWRKRLFLRAISRLLSVTLF